MTFYARYDITWMFICGCLQRILLLINIVLDKLKLIFLCKLLTPAEIIINFL